VVADDVAGEADRDRAKVVVQANAVAFQLAEVAVPPGDVRRDPAAADRLRAVPSPG
jgi:plastocyanin